MPGLYKVITFFLIQRVFDIQLLGSISSWQSTAQIIGFLTAIGWSSLILVRIPRLELHTDRARCFNELVAMGLATLVIFSSLIVSAGYLLGKTTDSVQITSWLIAWTLYQLPRHYYIALKSYKSALSVDIFVTILSLVCLSLSDEDNISAMLALSMALGGLISLISIQAGKDGIPKKINYDIKGIEFGLTNLMSGGISLAMIPLATLLGGESLAGIMSLFLSITAVSMLIPRSISLIQLPEISKNIDNKETLLSSISSSRRNIFLSNIFTTIFNIFVLIYTLQNSTGEITTSETAIILALLLIQNIISIQSITDSNILISKEHSREVMKINTKTFIAFCTTSTLIYQLQLEHSVAILTLALAAINVYRLYILKNEASRALKY